MKNSLYRHGLIFLFLVPLDHSAVYPLDTTWTWKLHLHIWKIKMLRIHQKKGMLVTMITLQFTYRIHFLSVLFYYFFNSSVDAFVCEQSPSLFNLKILIWWIWQIGLQMCRKPHLKRIKCASYFYLVFDLISIKGSDCCAFVRFLYHFF